MKRLTSSCAFLLALMTVITAWSLCASLIALTSDSISSSLVNVLTPALPPSTLSTEASVPVTNTQLRVSFRQPEGWTLIDSGTLRNQPWPVLYATYGIKGQPHAPTFTITKQDIVGTQFQDEREEQDGWVRTVTRSSQQRGAEIIEELRVTIDGFPAGGVEYIRKREVGFRLIASHSLQTNDFEWVSDVEYSEKLRQIYKAMLPTIRFELPPP